jgi:hypothetical protein
MRRVQKEKEKKMERINTMKTKSKRRKYLLIATWNVRSLYRPEGQRIKINELQKYKIAITAIQTRWTKSTLTFATPKNKICCANVVALTDKSVVTTDSVCFLNNLEFFYRIVGQGNR